MTLIGTAKLKSISFGSFFPKEEELTVTQYEELKASIDNISTVVNALANPMIYNYIDDNMPEWARARRRTVTAGR